MKVLVILLSSAASSNVLFYAPWLRPSPKIGSYYLVIECFTACFQHFLGGFYLNYSDHTGHLHVNVSLQGT